MSDSGKEDQETYSVTLRKKKTKNNEGVSKSSVEEVI